MFLFVLLYLCVSAYIHTCIFLGICGMRTPRYFDVIDCVSSFLPIQYHSLIALLAFVVFLILEVHGQCQCGQAANGSSNNVCTQQLFVRAASLSMYFQNLLFRINSCKAFELYIYIYIYIYYDLTLCSSLEIPIMLLVKLRIHS